MRSDNSKETCRRNFLKVPVLGAAGALAGAAMFPSASFSATEQENETQQREKSNHRIKKLSLQTAKPLGEMADFYRNVLEMKVLLSAEKLIVEAGKTQITFTAAAKGTQPYYHFAFNIPENKIVLARNWLVERTKLSVTPQRNREKGMPNDVMPMDFWDSHSVFFWDPAGNILELICRHNLKNGTKGEFRSDEILYASEIGFVTDGSVNSMADQIKSTFQLSQYRGGGEYFRALGDETGLLILFSRGGTPIGAKKGQRWQIFPTDVTVRPEIKLDEKMAPHTIKAG